MKFFVLDNPTHAETSALTDFRYTDDAREGDAPRCPLCGKFIGLIPTLPPVRVELETWDKIIGDIAFGPGDQMLFSERVVELFSRLNLSGLTEVLPAEVVKVKSHKKLNTVLPVYYCCQVARSRAVIDDIGSEIIRLRPWTCLECRTGGPFVRLKKVVLEDGSWSGEDLFVPRGLTGRILASEKFKNACEREKISNCLLIPADEFGFEYSYSKKQ